MVQNNDTHHINFIFLRLVFFILDEWAYEVQEFICMVLVTDDSVVILSILRIKLDL